MSTEQANPGAPRTTQSGGSVTRFLLALVRGYQRTISPALPVLFGPACGCRFHPTCSEYAAGALQAHGAARGCWLALCRLARCHPFQRGGFDPVPPARRYSVVRIEPARSRPASHALN
jgi:putative membrane protein insertion efficiency factor